MDAARQRSVQRCVLVLFAAALAVAGLRCSGVDPNPPDPHNSAELRGAVVLDASADAPDAEDAP